MRTGFALGACLLLGIGAASAQPQTAARDQKTFRTQVEAVEIDVRVVDDRGAAVPGLDRDDFELFEDGVRQRLATFTAVDVPYRAAPPPGLEPDVQSNRQAFDGRLYVLVLDDLHTQPQHAPRVRQAARRFVEEHLAANDRAAVVVTSGRTDASQELTASRAALLRAIDRFQGRKLRASTLERIDRYYLTRDTRERRNDGRPERIDDPLEFERGYNARVALDTVTGVARWLGTVPTRRKALLFLSEGIDYDIHDPIENREASAILTGTRDLIAAATRGNVNVYGIDPRGLTLDGGEGIEIGSLPEDTSLNLGTGALMAELRLGQDSLRTLSDETGGFAVINANNLAGDFDRIVKDVSSYYLLGYQPSNTRRDGRFRSVEVRIRRPGLRVIARRGYLAPKDTGSRRAEATEDAAPNLRPLLDSPVPVSGGLALDSTVAAFRGARGQASVLATLAVAPGLTLTEKDGLHHGRVDVSVLALSSDGKVYGGDQRAIQLTLKPDSLARVQQHGFRTLSRLELPPGRYQVRIAAREAGGGREGSVIHDLEVPDFSSAPVALSHLVLASQGSAQALTTRPDPEIGERLRVPPTTARRFDARDTLTLFAELYDNRAKAMTPIALTTTLTDGSGAVAFRAEEAIEPFAFEPARRSWTHRLEIPLRDVAPGTYTLRVEAAPRDEPGKLIRQEIPVEVQSRVDTTM